MILPQTKFEAILPKEPDPLRQSIQVGAKKFFPVIPMALMLKVLES